MEELFRGFVQRVLQSHHPSARLRRNRVLRYVAWNSARIGICGVVANTAVKVSSTEMRKFWCSGAASRNTGYWRRSRRCLLSRNAFKCSGDGATYQGWLRSLSAFQSTARFGAGSGRARRLQPRRSSRPQSGCHHPIAAQGVMSLAPPHLVTHAAAGLAVPTCGASSARGTGSGHRGPP